MERRLVKLGEKIHDAMVNSKMFDRDLAGSCAVTSWLFLTEAKRKFNIKLEYKVVYGHTWTEYHKTIYDLTATQFGEDQKVFVVPRSKIKSKVKDFTLQKYYLTGKFYNLDWVNREWNMDQRPANFSLRWLN
jgi:hypothetical protein